jgi:hypothetical protein
VAPTRLSPVSLAAIRAVGYERGHGWFGRFFVQIELRRFGFLLLLSRLFGGTAARPGARESSPHPFKSSFLSVDKNRLRACPPIAPMTLSGRGAPGTAPHARDDALRVRIGHPVVISDESAPLSAR